jgi:beta-lactamase regulating signal transducer with metallopeptidase domain
MMLSWMMYVIVVSLLLSAAAFAAERAARVRGAPHRWIWTATILASLFIPATIASVSIELPRFSSDRVDPAPTPLRTITSEYLSPTVWVGALAPEIKESPQVDDVARGAWLSMSLLVLVGLLISAAHLYVRKRQWAKATVAAREVFVADDVGPAVVGLLSPAIVVPRWLLARSEQFQKVVLAHEQSHIDARDQQVLAIALCLIVLMPWNLPLWWQLRRLRYAIEVDCDTRVLRSGHALGDYGETLIEVGQHRSGFVGAVAGMSESRSFLERRIALMTSNRLKYWRWASAGLATVAVACVAIAAQVSPPNVNESAPATAATKPSERTPIKVSANVLERYVGEYALSDEMIVSVRRDGERLLARLTGQPEFEIFPESEHKFFWKVVDAQATFAAENGQPASGLTLYQAGQTMPAPRVEKGTAERAQAALDTKIQAQTATPGSDAALKRMLESARLGKPNYDEMSAGLAKVVREQLSMMQPQLQKLGAVKSVEFQGVGSAGWDSYKVQHEHGSSQWRVAMSPDGKIGGALMVQLP